MALAYASMEVAIMVLLLLSGGQAQFIKIASTMDTISKNEREDCFYQCNQIGTCRFFGVDVKGKCFALAEPSITKANFMKKYLQPVATIEVTSVGYNRNGKGKIVLIGGNQVPTSRRGIVVVRLNITHSQVTLGDYRNFDTYRPIGAQGFVKYIEKLALGDIVVAANSDDITHGLRKHLTYFKSEGLAFEGVAFRGKMAFIFQKDYPDKTILITRPPGAEDLVAKFSVYVSYYGAPPDLYYFSSSEPE